VVGFPLSPLVPSVPSPPLPHLIPPFLPEHNATRKCRYEVHLLSLIVLNFFCVRPSTPFPSLSRRRLPKCPSLCSGRVTAISSAKNFLGSFFYYLAFLPRMIPSPFKLSPPLPVKDMKPRLTEPFTAQPLFHGRRSLLFSMAPSL